MTRPASRHRGRIYLGPVNELAFSTDGNGRVKVSTPLIDTLKAAASTLNGALSATAWSVWSRANAAMYSVVGGWVDTTPDTIRRRGPKPAGKAFWT
jgi:hypothetical protein